LTIAAPCDGKRASWIASLKNLKYFDGYGNTVPHLPTGLRRVSLTIEDDDDLAALEFQNELSSLELHYDGDFVEPPLLSRVRITKIHQSNYSPKMVAKICQWLGTLPELEQCSFWVTPGETFFGTPEWNEIRSKYPHINFR
jgi:hypothetical protein